MDKYWYPTLYTRWQNILKEDFYKNNKWLSVHCTIEEYLRDGWNGGLYKGRKEPTQEVINEFAKYQGIESDVAKKYFDKYCVNGCKSVRANSLKIKDKETIAMNLKMLGRNIDKFMCKKCLIKFLDINEDRWDKYIEEFKATGCNLF